MTDERDTANDAGPAAITDAGPLARAPAARRPIRKLLVANRGEIACRVLRTCRAMGIATVAVYSEADAGAQHVRQADEAWPIGGPAPADSYLRGDAVIAAALASGADAVHPGYGFLSENADFADAVVAAGLVFVGPSAATMRKMGSKAGAKDLMAAAGVPVVPGYTGEDQAPMTLAREAARIGFPLMIKAAHGGGGKGMRIVRRLEEFLPLLESCQREAKNAFGRDRVLLERYVESPRHIEIQVFGDAHGHTLHLGERECSAQRRYQKVLEESPSPFLSAASRAAMGAAAVQAAQAIDYVNAGTVEFIVAPDGQFYFMEINTRLQVEHPVTEFVTGLDLVEWQLRVAAGEPLPLAQAAIRHAGHAIEVRLYAEDPDAGFLPGSGRLQRLRLPVASPHVRIDAGVVEGDTVSIFYDPMIAKLIVHDVDRPSALARLREALAACDVVGPKSNIAFLEALVRHPAVVDATIDTGYLDRNLGEFVGGTVAPPDATWAAAAVAQLAWDDAAARGRADAGSPWRSTDGWRLGRAAPRQVRLALGGVVRDLSIANDGAAQVVTLDTGTVRIEGTRIDAARGAASPAAVDDDAGRSGSQVLTLRADDHALRFLLWPGAAGPGLHDGTHRFGFTVVDPAQAAVASDAAGDGRVRAPMPGRVVLLRAKVGEHVTAGQELLVMEAMKMELALKAPRDGVVGEIRAAAGDFVEADAALVVLEVLE